MTSIVSAFVLLASPTAKETIERSWDETLVIGHRGAASMHPENTPAAFAAGMSSGAVAVECDVHMSQDGVPFVIHDKTLDRTTKGKGAVKDHSARQLQDLGVPTLEQIVLQAKGKSILVIEIKDGKGVVPAVAKLVRQHGTEAHTIIFSFTGGYVREAKELLPTVPAIWLVSKAYTPPEFGELDALRRDYRADGIGFSYKTLTKELADHVRGSKVPLFVWTVPPGDEVARLKALRVNFIITDHPREVGGLLAGG